MSLFPQHHTEQNRRVELYIDRSRRLLAVCSESEAATVLREEGCEANEARLFVVAASLLEKWREAHDQQLNAERENAK